MNSTFWKFLNERFTLFLISVVIIGSFSWVFAAEQDSRRNRQNIKSELIHRKEETLKVLKYVKKELVESSDYYSPKTINEYASDMLNADKSKLGEIGITLRPFLNPDNERKSFSFLLQEYRRNEWGCYSFHNSDEVYNQIKDKATNAPDNTGNSESEKKQAKEEVDIIIKEIKGLLSE